MSGFPVSSVSSSVGPVVNLYAPLLLHLVPHFFVGFGPRVQHSFGVERGGPYEGTQLTLVGGDFVIAVGTSPPSILPTMEQSQATRRSASVGIGARLLMAGWFDP